MKTHIPTKLRKALIAALFAVSSVAYNAQADEPIISVGDYINWSTGEVSGETPGGMGITEESTGYVDLAFSGSDRAGFAVGHAIHYGYDEEGYHCDSLFTDTYIFISPESDGVFRGHSITARQGKDVNSTLVPSDHDGARLDVFGYSDAWSNGNITVNSEAVLEMSSFISAHGTLSIAGGSRVTAGSYVSAGEILVTAGELNAKNINVTQNNLWDVTAENPYDGEDSTGELNITGSDAKVTATGIVSAAGGVDVSNSAHLNASKITSKMTGSNGYVRALPNQNLTITGAIASEKTQYIVDNGCTISLGTIGELVNEGTEAEPQMVMHGNGNYFGYGEDSNNIKADAIYVLGDIISDNNSLAALGSAVYDHTEDIDSAAIRVDGSITGNGNELFVRGQDAASIWVAKDISGNHNELTINDGDIHVGGTLGRSKDSEKGIAKGNSLAAGDDITIHQLSDNENLSIDAWNGEVTVENASEATLLNSHITAADDVVIARDETGSTKELKLVASDVTSEDGDITANQVLVVENGTLSAENGKITVVGLDGKAASVHAEDLEGKYIKLDANGSTEADVVVTGDMTSTEETILIMGYNGEKPRVTVDGNQTAQTTLEIIDSNVSVGGNQKSVEDGISVSKSTLVVGGDQEAGTTLAIDTGSKVTVGHVDEETGEIVGGNQKVKKDITISDSDVTILADQTSTEGSITISDTNSEQDPTLVTVDGNQQAKENISVTGSTLHVGVLVEDEDTETYSIEGGKQIAGGDISIINSLVEVLDSMESTDGNIQIQDGTVTVGATDPSGVVVQAGDMTAKKDISMDHSMVNVLGGQKSSEGSISVTNGSEVYVNEDQQAHGSISVNGSELYVGGSQVTETGGIQVSNGAYVAVLEDQQAAGDITIDGTSEVEVLGSQTSTNGAITMSNGSEVHVDGDQQASGTIKVDNADVYIGGTQKSDTGNIVIRDNAHESVFGDQTAEAGSIIVAKDSTLTVGAKDEDGNVISQGDQWAAKHIKIVAGSAVEVIGDQTARDEDIIVKDSTLTVGAIQENAPLVPGWPSTYELIGGNQTADKGDIAITNSTANVLGNQEAVMGSISVAGSTLTVGAKTEDGEIVQKGNQTANLDITIVDSTVTVLGNQKATEGSIAISATPGTGVTSEVFVGGNQEAGNAISVTGSQLTVGTAETVTDEQTGEQHVVLTDGNQTAGTGDITISNSTVKVLGDQTATKGGIKIDKLSLVTIGTVDVDGTVLAGDQLAKEDIRIDSSTLMVMDNQTSQEGSISVQALDDFSLVMVGGSQTAKKHIGIFGSKEHEKPTTVLVGEDQIAGEGNIAINDAQVAVKGKVVALGDGNDGTGIVTLAGATYDVGVSLQAKELNIGTIDNPSTVTINVGSLDADGKPLDTVLDVDKLAVAEGNTLHTGNVKMDKTDVTIKGAVEVGVKDEDPEKAIAANWDTEGSHLISGEGASLKANGNIRIASAAEGDTTAINNGATVAATGNVTIQGLADALAEVDAATVRAAGDIILDNAELKNNTETDITTKGSDIVLKNRVEISDTILNVLPPEEGDEGVINVTEDADVQLYRGTVNVFNGKLAGTGTVTANEENLDLSHDSTAFNGTINMVHDNEQTLYISDKGVGDDATINLQEGSSLGTLVGGQDAHLGNVYSSDGSHIQMNAVDKGNRTTATSLNLTSGTTYELFASTDDTTGALLADTITVSDGINANGARVRAHSDAQLETLADGSRFTIAGGTVESAFNEDVLYDMSGPQRQRQTRNMHLEHNANGVDLVVSENYKGIDYSNANVNAVREIILPLDAAADHRPGRLAQSDSNLDHILDALDYTRSGADAKAGLLSVSAAANLIVPNMMMDASRHHLSTLRDHMNAPVCTKDTQSKGNVWAAYTGGHDFIGSDDNMGKYTHSYNGAIIGGDYAVNCNWAIGLSVGYQNSIARTDATRADADIISGDLYVVGRTGKFTHRFSMGLASYNTDVKRGTRIAAKGHGYDSLSTGDADGMSWNFGYQLSRSYAINEVSAITPYLAVDVALQRIDTMTEKGQGDASVVTDYEDFVQTDAALGVSYSHTFASFNQQRGMFAFDLAVHGEFSEHRATAQNHFVDSPADTWKTRSAKRAPLYGELGGHVQVPFTEHFSGTAGVNFEFSDDRTYIGGHAGVNYRF